MKNEKTKIFFHRFLAIIAFAVGFLLGSALMGINSYNTVHTTTPVVGVQRSHVLNAKPIAYEYGFGYYSLANNFRIVRGSASQPLYSAPYDKFSRQNINDDGYNYNLWLDMPNDLAPFDIGLTLDSCTSTFQDFSVPPYGNSFWPSDGVTELGHYAGVGFTPSITLEFRNTTSFDYIVTLDLNPQYPFACFWGVSGSSLGTGDLYRYSATSTVTLRLYAKTTTTFYCDDTSGDYSFGFKGFYLHKINDATYYDGAYSDGYTFGYSAGLTAPSFLDTMKNALDSVASLLSIQVFPNITVATLIFIPLAFSVLLFILKLGGN